jgi:hypothetical protein
MPVKAAKGIGQPFRRMVGHGNRSGKREWSLLTQPQRVAKGVLFSVKKFLMYAGKKPIFAFSPMGELDFDRWLRGFRVHSPARDGMIRWLPLLKKK